MRTTQSMASQLKSEIGSEASKLGNNLNNLEGVIATNEFKNSIPSGEMGESGKKQFKKGKGVDKEENKESTGSGSAGGFEGPLFSETKQEMQEKCWTGFQQKGMKKKGNRMVPNCVKKGEEGDIKKVETKEATGSGSSGSYETNAAWAKSQNKKDWRGKSKTQIPGGKFVQVKKKCKKFPYCNQGDIKALKIFENETVKKVIHNISVKHNIRESVIKNIIAYEYENTFLKK
jgi:hypothetical protein